MHEESAGPCRFSLSDNSGMMSTYAFLHIQKGGHDENASPGGKEETAVDKMKQVTRDPGVTVIWVLQDFNVGLMKAFSNPFFLPSFLGTVMFKSFRKKKR